MEHGSAAGSIFGHPALPSVVAVGAVDVHDPGLDTVEPFSSHGPARVDFPTLQVRAKPDLVGFDGVAISNAGGFPSCPPFCAFFGTSAAAPHSAGIAALLLDQDPTLTPAEVQAALTRGAVDIGPQGFDDASGFGRIDALAAAEPSTSPTTTSTTTTTSTSSNPIIVRSACCGRAGAALSLSTPKELMAPPMTIAVFSHGATTRPANVAHAPVSQETGAMPLCDMAAMGTA